MWKGEKCIRGRASAGGSRKFHPDFGRRLQGLGWTFGTKATRTGKEVWRSEREEERQGKMEQRRMVGRTSFSSPLLWMEWSRRTVMGSGASKPVQRGWREVCDRRDPGTLRPSREVLEQAGKDLRLAPHPIVWAMGNIFPRLLVGNYFRVVSICFAISVCVIIG